MLEGEGVLGEVVDMRPSNTREDFEIGRHSALRIKGSAGFERLLG